MIDAVQRLDDGALHSRSLSAADEHSHGNTPRTRSTDFPRVETSVRASLRHELPDRCTNPYFMGLCLVLPVRIELTTSPLPRGCSTTELRQRSSGERRANRAGNGAILATRGKGAQARPRSAKPRQMLLRGTARVLPVGELEQHLLDPLG